MAMKDLAAMQKKIVAALKNSEFSHLKSKDIRGWTTDKNYNPGPNEGLIYLSGLDLYVIVPASKL